MKNNQRFDERYLEKQKEAKKDVAAENKNEVLNKLEEFRKKFNEKNQIEFGAVSVTKQANPAPNDDPNNNANATKQIKPQIKPSFADEEEEDDEIIVSANSQNSNTVQQANSLQKYDVEYQGSKASLSLNNNKPSFTVNMADENSIRAALLWSKEAGFKKISMSQNDVDAAKKNNIDINKMTQEMGLTISINKKLDEEKILETQAVNNANLQQNLQQNPSYAPTMQATTPKPNMGNARKTQKNLSKNLDRAPVLSSCLNKALQMTGQQLQSNPTPTWTNTLRPEQMLQVALIQNLAASNIQLKQLSKQEVAFLVKGLTAAQEQLNQFMNNNVQPQPQHHVQAQKDAALTASNTALNLQTFNNTQNAQLQTQQNLDNDSEQNQLIQNQNNTANDEVASEENEHENLEHHIVEEAEEHEAETLLSKDGEKILGQLQEKESGNIFGKEQAQSLESTFKAGMTP